MIKATKYGTEHDTLHRGQRKQLQTFERGTLLVRQPNRLGARKRIQHIGFDQDGGHPPGAILFRGNNRLTI